MTHHSDHDSADENDGKYSTDERMTFDSVLKSSLRERDENREILDGLVEKDLNAKQRIGKRTVEKRPNGRVKNLLLVSARSWLRDLQRFMSLIRQSNESPLERRRGSGTTRVTNSPERELTKRRTITSSRLRIDRTHGTGENSP